MTILDRICAYKKLEVASKKEVFPVSLLTKSPYFSRTSISLLHSILESNTGIIAEHKRRSPSKSVINEKSELPDVVLGYRDAKVSGISILTDTKYFGGSLDDLLLARKTVSLPLLRKEFIVDPYQIYEAKAYGADAILLIASCLSQKEVVTFSEIAKDIGLEVLIEIHNEEELEKSLMGSIDLIGVNNRNLKTFEVTLETSKKLSKLIPDNVLKISESGIAHPDAIRELKKYGFQGFLMGEHFMRTENPGKAAKKFIEESA